MSKEERNEIETYAKVGATLKEASDVTVPSFRTTDNTDAATKAPLQKAPCAET
jgi:hypothetical protein